MNLDLFFYAFVGFIVAACALYAYTNTDVFQLKCIVSGVNGNKYCVRDRTKVSEAADLLARVADKCQQLVDKLVETDPGGEMTRLLKKNFNPAAIVETLPTSEFTAYSENKGEKMAFCLTPKKNQNIDRLIDEHTLTFVAIHEMSHLATPSVGHKDEFWSNFKTLLEKAKEWGIHEPVDYSKKSQEYCSMEIKDSPYFQWGGGGSGGSDASSSVPTKPR